MPTPLHDLPIRRLTPADLHACADLAEDRGWAREEHRWHLLLTAGTGWGVDAPEGKGLATACVVTSYGTGLAAVGVMLVAARFTRQGLARRLMTHVMDEAGDTPLALHATPQGRPLYERLGFTETGSTETLRGTFRPPPEETPAVTTRPATAGDLPALVRLDQEIFGLDRTHLLTRLPAFADRIRVAHQGPTLTGYATLWPTPASDVISPLIAQDTPTAQALVRSLATDHDRPVRLDVDVRHEALLTWLRAHGLDRTASTTTMVRGIPRLPGDWTRHYAPFNLATG